ncbi:hypothetical protein ASPZODRAFT_152296 [Penicilliopsis zonata CBS 506.65]|uniref:Nineteen complex-related protein 2-domain-containing protein n=1 Tax=Penicilliopsis zonata CBS 506.65 TaxID=1073090 RepID=A0A1L9SG58_9EURO|nr:hypothetical protein ASPZODRAFT_152296 [Penicilliopsis zonata CBS 506.65]OJJ46067.1 hypothetical protein ASPZODRAFT_152296 [Penicilliopsis zonata CBS 506.65]
MSAAFANRRKPRKILQDDEDGNDGEQDNGPVVKRPASSKPKPKSKLRLSFGPGATSMADDEDQDGGVITPKRHGLGRKVLEKSALHRSITPSGSSERLPLRVGHDQDRPSYSDEYLKELRNSTPSTPKTGTDDEKEKTVDVAAKFGEIMHMSAPSAIPSEAEIREKKARRARLAKEQDYISLDDTAEDSGQWVLKDEEQEVETRLVRDDEDFAEGFDEYVEDGKISLGRKAEREQQQRQRETMRELIDDAEALSDEDDSDLEEKAAYEAAQTRAAMGNGSSDLPGRPKTPPKMTALPRLTTSLDRLRLTLAVMEKSKAQMITRMDDLRKEKAEIAVREVEIQALIKEAGENYERLRTEAGLTPGSEVDGTGAGALQKSRGLESFGASMGTPTPGSEEET